MKYLFETADIQFADIIMEVQSISRDKYQNTTKNIFNPVVHIPHAKPEKKSKFPSNPLLFKGFVWFPVCRC